MADQGHRRSPGRNSPARGRGRGTPLSPPPPWQSLTPPRGQSSPPARGHSSPPPRSNQQDPGLRGGAGQSSGSRSPEMSSGSVELSSSGSEGEGESAARGVWGDESLKGLLECVPPLLNPMAFLERTQHRSIRPNRGFGDVFSMRGGGALAMVPAPPIPLLPRGGARAIVEYVEPAQQSPENEEAGIHQRHPSDVSITLSEVDRDIMRMEQEEQSDQSEHPGVERDVRSAVPEGRSTEDLQSPSYRSPLRKDIVHYKKDPPRARDEDVEYTREQHPADNRMTNMVRKYMGDGVSGMIFEMWPDLTGPLPQDLVNKVLYIRRDIAEPPHCVKEHVGRHGGDQRCFYYTNDQEQFEDGCGCWEIKLRLMMRDPRGPNMYKRAATAVVCKYVRDYLPRIDGHSENWNWSREHNNLFFSWLYHYGEPHEAGREYNFLLTTGRVLQFQHGTGLDFPGIVDKLYDWESTVAAWHGVSLSLKELEEEMQYSVLQSSFSMIEEWLEKHPEVNHISYVPSHMMMGWGDLVNKAGRLVDLENIVMDYISRQQRLILREYCWSRIKLQKKQFVLRTLEEINYEIVFTPHMYILREYEDHPFLQEITTATNMSVQQYFGDNRGEQGLEESIYYRPPGKENRNPDNPDMF